MYITNSAFNYPKLDQFQALRHLEYLDYRGLLRITKRRFYLIELHKGGALPKRGNRLTIISTKALQS